MGRSSTASETNLNKTLLAPGEIHSIRLLSASGHRVDLTAWPNRLRRSSHGGTALSLDCGALAGEQSSSYAAQRATHYEGVTVRCSRLQNSR